MMEILSLFIMMFFIMLFFLSTVSFEEFICNIFNVLTFILTVFEELWRRVTRTQQIVNEPESSSEPTHKEKIQTPTKQVAPKEFLEELVPRHKRYLRSWSSHI